MMTAVYPRIMRGLFRELPRSPGIAGHQTGHTAMPDWCSAISGCPRQALDGEEISLPPIVADQVEAER